MSTRTIIITALLFKLSIVALVLPATTLADEDNAWSTQFLLRQSGFERPASFNLAEQLLPKQEIRGAKVPRPTRLGRKQATDKVQQRYRKHKVLSVNLISSKGPATYRVKTLSSQGVVKYVFVDGNSGEVFE